MSDLREKLESKITDIIRDETECDDPYCQVMYAEDAAKKIVAHILKGDWRKESTDK